jgi:16S rRNA G527 N7-methylase RsmG
MTLVEARERKAAFLREVVRVLELEQVEVVRARFEEISVRPSNDGSFDIITLRAVRLSRPLAHAIEKHLTSTGRFFWFRGHSLSFDSSSLVTQGVIDLPILSAVLDIRRLRDGHK